MADSKLPPNGETGLMIAAACYRVKYRKHDGAKVRIRAGELGVHKKSRGGEYPSGLRVQDLLKHCARNGVVQEEADSNCIAVEEMPVHEMISRTGYVTTLDYNIRQFLNDAILNGIYDEPHNRVYYSLLAHNHFMTICRALLAKQLWRLADITEMGIVFCDHAGRLSAAIFAQHSNGEQLQVIIQVGFLCEVLSWKMDVEEPEAAAIISTAMNEASSASMRTTELQAIKVLKGEIIIQMGMDVSQKVCFQTVVDRVKKQLGPAVADPELVELFEFLISHGVGTNTYIDDFLDWAGASIHPKKGNCALQPSHQLTRLSMHHAARMLLPSERTVGSRQTVSARTPRASGDSTQWSKYYHSSNFCGSSMVNANISRRTWRRMSASTYWGKLT